MFRAGLHRRYGETKRNCTNFRKSLWRRFVQTMRSHWEPTRHSHVCRPHYVSLDFINDVEYYGLRKETSHQQDCCPNHLPSKLVVATLTQVVDTEARPSRAAKKKFLTMLRQHSQYDSRLGFSFRVLVRVRVRLTLILTPTPTLTLTLKSTLTLTLTQNPNPNHNTNSNPKPNPNLTLTKTLTCYRTGNAAATWLGKKDLQPGRATAHAAAVTCWCSSSLGAD